MSRTGLLSVSDVFKERNKLETPLFLEKRTRICLWLLLDTFCILKNTWSTQLSKKLLRNSEQWQTLTSTKFFK